MTLSQKWDFGLFVYNFDKWEVWTCPLMRNMISEPIWFRIRLNESIGMSLVAKTKFSLYGYNFVAKMRFWSICLQVWWMGSLNLSLDAKHDMWAYLILYSVKWKYWIDFISKVFGFVFGKIKVLECLCRENEILAYMVTILKNIKDELVPWFKT